MLWRWGVVILPKKVPTLIPTLPPINRSQCVITVVWVSKTDGFRYEKSGVEWGGKCTDQIVVKEYTKYKECLDPVCTQRFCLSWSRRLSSELNFLGVLCLDIISVFGQYRSTKELEYHHHTTVSFSESVSDCPSQTQGRGDKRSRNQKPSSDSFGGVKPKEWTSLLLTIVDGSSQHTSNFSITFTIQGPCLIRVSITIDNLSNLLANHSFDILLKKYQRHLGCYDTGATEDSSINTLNIDWNGKLRVRPSEYVEINFLHRLKGTHVPKSPARRNTKKPYKWP